jgi:hypothetical protein
VAYAGSETWFQKKRLTSVSFAPIRAGNIYDIGLGPLRTPEKPRRRLPEDVWIWARMTDNETVAYSWNGGLDWATKTFTQYVGFISCLPQDGSRCVVVTGPVTMWSSLQSNTALNDSFSVQVTLDGGQTWTQIRGSQLSVPSNPTGYYGIVGAWVMADGRTVGIQVAWYNSGGPAYGMFYMDWGVYDLRAGTWRWVTRIGTSRGTEYQVVPDLSDPFRIYFSTGQERDSVGYLWAVLDFKGAPDIHDKIMYSSMPLNKIDGGGAPRRPFAPGGPSGPVYIFARGLTNIYGQRAPSRLITWDSGSFRWVDLYDPPNGTDEPYLYWVLPGPENVNECWALEDASIASVRGDIFEGRIYYTSNRGVSWQRLSAASPRFDQIAIHPGRNVVYYINGNNLYRAEISASGLGTPTLVKDALSGRPGLLALGLAT